MSPFQRAESPNHRLPPATRYPRAAGRSISPSEFRAICSSWPGSVTETIEYLVWLRRCHPLERDEALAGERIITVSRWGGRRFGLPCALTRLPADALPRTWGRTLPFSAGQIYLALAWVAFSPWLGAATMRPITEPASGRLRNRLLAEETLSSSSSLSGVGRLNQRPARSVRASANRCCRRHG